MPRELDIRDCVAFGDVMGLYETEDALLCEIEGEEIWIPYSCIHPDSEVDGPEMEGILVITKSIARKKGLYE